MTKQITQKTINDAVWKACDTFRGSIDPSVYKDYVLTMLFIKYLSDVHEDKYEAVKNQNKLRQQDIEHIVDTYRKFTTGKLLRGIVEDKFSYIATFDEIKENDFNLNIPRYVDTFEEEPEVDIAAVQKEINKIEGKLKTVQADMDKYLKELGV